MLLLLITLASLEYPCHIAIGGLVRILNMSGLVGQPFQIMLLDQLTLHNLLGQQGLNIIDLLFQEPTLVLTSMATLHADDLGHQLLKLGVNRNRPLCIERPIYLLVL